MEAILTDAGQAARTSALPEPQTIDLGSGTVRYRDSGGRGLPVLMTHGIGGSLEMWNRQFENHDPALRLMAWDMPSHGLSGPAPRDTQLEGIADQGWRLLQALGVEKVLLVGNSLGAAVSLRMAATLPQGVCALLLLAGATLGHETILPFRLMTLPGLGTLMSKPGPAAVKHQIESIVHRRDAITPEVLAAVERNVMRPGGAANFLALLREMTGFGGQRAEVRARSDEILRSLQVPVSFVHGEHDAVLPVAHSRHAQRLVPGSELVVLPACGHTPQLEDPAAVDRALRELRLRAGV